MVPAAASGVPFRDLLRLCVTLSQRACGVIRTVHGKREQQGAKTNGGALKGTAVGGPAFAHMKDATDSRSYLTEADVKAQALIVSGLRKRFGNALRMGRKIGFSFVHILRGNLESRSGGVRRRNGLLILEGRFAVDPHTHVSPLV